MAHALTRERTVWIFVSDSDEPRHLQDIIFAVDALRKKSVANEQILVFTDHSKSDVHFSPYGIVSRPLAVLASVLAGLKGCETAVLVATGHGVIDGIGATRTALTPHQLLSAIRTIPGMAAGVLVVCQCFAGIFDILDASTEPELVIIGATRLNNSISALTKLAAPIKQLDGTPGFDSWSANIFMVTFFDWISKPVDIDGDGQLTIADAFKYTGVFSNKKLIEMKSSLYMEIRQMAADLESLKVAAASPKRTVMDVLRYGAATQRLQGNLEILHLHQEAWLLHARLSRDISFAL